MIGYIDQIESEKKIMMINGNWNEDNIHLLLYLDPISKGYDSLLNDYNINLLIKLLQKPSLDYFFYITSTIIYFIPLKISEKIIEKIEWNKQNIIYYWPCILMQMDMKIF